MKAYRVAGSGLVIFDRFGEPVARLRPGRLVVGDLEVADESGGSKDELIDRAKRLRGYADKMIRPAEDKAR